MVLKVELDLRLSGLRHINDGLALEDGSRNQITARHRSFPPTLPRRPRPAVRWRAGRSLWSAALNQPHQLLRIERQAELANDHDRVGGGLVLMLRHRDGETIRRASPETAFDQELVKLKQRGK